MIPLFFGPPERAKYGIFHQAIGAGLKGRGIVFCDPLFGEALNAHRTLRFASDSMAAARWNSFRFDYFGTGDSAGETDEFSLTQAGSDIHEAIEELKATADLASVYLLGMRLGGTLAMKVACERSDVRGVILWDPIIDGSTLIDEYAVLAEHDPLGIQVQGFVLTERLQEEIRGTSMRGCLERFAGPALMVCTSATPAQRDLVKECAHVEFREISAPQAWSKAPGGGVRAIPGAVIREIQSWPG